jgi:hypothetical protein
MQNKMTSPEYPFRPEPIRPNEDELRAERKLELQRQFDYLHTDKGVLAWKEKHPERWEADIKRLKDELPSLKVAEKEPVKEKKEEEKKEKVEEKKPKRAKKTK